MIIFFSYIRICKNRIEDDSRLIVQRRILRLGVKKILKKGGGILSCQGECCGYQKGRDEGDSQEL
jgi:hypothetical protein